MSNRTYSSALNNGKGAPTFQYIWDPSLVVTSGVSVPISGNWRVFTTADISNNSISLTGASFNITSVAVTGGQIAITNGSITVVNPVLPVSGIVTSITVDSGNRAVQVVNTAPIPFSGVTVANTVDTGVRAVNVTNTAPIPFSGSVMNIGGFIGLTGNPLVSLGNAAVNVTGTIFTITTGTIGGNVTVNSVAITGAPVVSLTGNLPVTIVGTPSVTIPFTAPVFVTGSFSSAPANTVITGFNSTISPLAVSGNFTSTPGNTAITGFNSTISPLAVSGAFTASVSDTGNRSVQVVNTAPIPVSGVVQAQVTIGALAITGFNSTIAPLAITGITFANTIDTGVRAVNIVSSITQATFTSGGFVAVTGTVQTVDPTGNLFLASISGSLITLLADNSAITGFNSTIPPLAISGVVNTTVTVGNVAITGVVNTVDITGNLYLAAISGALTANLNGAAPVSGLVGITNTAPIAISGVVNTVVTGTVSASVPNPLGVTGVAYDRNFIYSGINTYNFVPMGGRVANPSGIGAITGGYTTGAFAMLNLSPQGALFVSQGNLDPLYDKVTTQPLATGLASSNTVSGLAGIGWGTPLPANPNRLAWGITNMTTGVAFVRMGLGATSGNAHFPLKGGSVVQDGLGASWTDMPAIWKGPVSVTGYFSTNSIYTCWEL